MNGIQVLRLERVTNTGSRVTAPGLARDHAFATLERDALYFAPRVGQEVRVFAWAKPVSNEAYGQWTRCNGAELGYDRWEATFVRVNGAEREA